MRYTGTMRVLVIAGGTSSEREISLRSGDAIATALKSAGHEVSLFDPEEQPILQQLASNYDVAFPIVHGQGGEDGSLQQQLNDIGLPYVGSGVTASRLCFDKPEYKQVLAQHELPVARGDMVEAATFRGHPLVNQPFVLKPRSGGSSVDTFIVRDPQTADWNAMLSSLQTHGEMLLEELIPGVEITVGVLGDQALPVVEIVPPANGEFDYENKYNGATTELCPPEHIDERAQTLAREYAVHVHQLCGCADFSRTDMIVRADGSITILETNTLPGMTDESLLPKAARAVGLDMSGLCDELVHLASARAS